jgi:hypothetical protein
LFGPQGLARPQGPTQPTEQESLRRYAAELRGLAERGMKPIAYAKKAKELEDRANELDKANQPAPADTIRDDAAAGDQEKNSGAENIEFKPVSKQAGELQDRKKQVETWIEALKNRKPTTRYSEYPDKEVVSLLDQHAERIHRLRKWEREHGPLAEGDQERLDKDLVRHGELVKEYDHRKELANANRRLEAINEGIKTGKLTLSKEEMIKLLGNVKDSYKDAGYRGEYNPDYMRTSDLTGRKIRRYVELPDGRIAHPDELILARKRVA